MTLKEVAAIAGVSPSAVSRYMNGGSLSEDKAARIRDAIQQTGYRPNRAAQALRTGQLAQVGLIVPKIHSAAVSEVSAGINEVLSQEGYVALIGATGESDAQEVAYLELMQENNVSGIILMGTCMTPAKEDAFRRCQVPLVITGQCFPGFSCVYHDDFAAARELAGLMIRRGRKHIAYLGVSERDPAAGLSRRRGAQAALNEAGLDGNNMLRLEGAFSLESGERNMRQVLEQMPEVDGVVCATDMIAHGAMLALRNAGRRIPQDISVAGVGDDWANCVSVPQLTTARLYHAECGKDAASLLLQMISHSQSAAMVRQISLGYSIIDRGSV